jgi:hypothetical protein
VGVSLASRSSRSHTGTIATRLRGTMDYLLR